MLEQLTEYSLMAKLYNGLLYQAVIMDLNEDN